MEDSDVHVVTDNEDPDGMLVLWHLHNQDAPKFVQQCASCSREILTGYRYNCQSCPDFDQCQECYNNPNIVRHYHPLTPTPVGEQQSQLMEAQRQERQRHIQLHLQLLQHAATCNSPNCPSRNCIKMKGLLRHGSTCTVRIRSPFTFYIIMDCVISKLCCFELSIHPCVLPSL